MTLSPPFSPPLEGLLLIDKPIGSTSFSLVAKLRHLTKVKTIGHAGTLDPFATGVMVLLIGKNYTRLSSQFLECDKEYTCTVTLGAATDSYDIDGEITSSSDKIPSLEEIKSSLKAFNGKVLQTPPMFSAKKVGGKKLYELARRGITIERAAVPVEMETTIQIYNYPYLELHVRCSKGTYIRSIAHDLGLALGSYGHLSKLKRIRSGEFLLENCMTMETLLTPSFDLLTHLKKWNPSLCTSSQI